MKRILMMVLRNILRVPVLWIRLCYHAAHPDRYTDRENYDMIRYITDRANIGGNVTMKSSGQEYLPEKDGFILFPNHQGMYDVLALVNVCDRPLSVVAKKEIANIQFLKQIFACLRAYMMDRDDIRQSMQIIVDVSREVQNGRNFIIFPEGTRSKKGNEVQEFKGGSFKAATKARCPIVPVALIDSFKPFDTNSISPVTVQVHFLKPLYYEDYKDMKTTEIATLVRKRIQEMIREQDGLKIPCP